MSFGIGSWFKGSFFKDNQWFCPFKTHPVFFFPLNTGPCFEMFSRLYCASSRVFCCVSNFSACFFNNFQCFSETAVEMLSFQNIAPGNFITLFKFINFPCAYHICILRRRCLDNLFLPAYSILSLLNQKIFGACLKINLVLQLR